MIVTHINIHIYMLVKHIFGSRQLVYSQKKPESYICLSPISIYTHEYQLFYSHVSTHVNLYTKYVDHVIV
jgi:hypothetical protein